MAVPSYQLELIYFKLDVLGKYFDGQGVYEIQDNVTGGEVSTSGTYLSRFTEDEQDKMPYLSIRYGKRKLSTGGYCGAAVLKDLSHLSLKEQGYWHSFEIEGSEFSNNDEGFSRFFERNFMGKWIGDNDPIANLIESVELFNSFLEPNVVYNNTTNKYLRYPVNNTKKDFSDSCSELFKIIGNGSINIDNLKTILTRDYNFDKSNFVHSESKRNLSATQLLHCLIEQIDGDLLGRFKKAYGKIKDGRIDADHRILSPSVDDNNYIELFKGYCNEMAESLTGITRNLQARRTRDSGL